MSTKIKQMKQRRRVVVPVCPGEPTDGSGVVCIHLYVRDETGPFTEPHVLHPHPERKGELVAKRTRGRLACGKSGVAPTTRNGRITTVPRTEEREAVTCPKCKASEFYKQQQSEEQ